ncbi:MAG: DUF4097 family beta strand repeat protein [Acidobacteria bacterium]|nr:DUF4097 family beta strand repeat protein [Acidobacteriota bacterium]
MSTTRYAATAVTVLALAGTGFSAGDLRKELHFRVGKHPTISINNPYGPVRVRAGVVHQVEVVATLHSDKVELDQSQSRNRISLVSHLLPGADAATGMVEFEVLIPPEANLTLHSDSGPLHAEKLRGDVVMEGSNAPIEVIDFGEGHVHVHTLNGTVKLTNVHNGHVEVVSMYGDVVLNAVSGPVVTVNSNSGRIEYDGDFGNEGEYDFTSHTGTIEAVAPAYASIDVLARSTQGRVESDFSLEPKHTPFISRSGSAFAGTLGKAASSVRLFSFSGKIHLKKRQD